MRPWTRQVSRLGNDQRVINGSKALAIKGGFSMARRAEQLKRRKEIYEAKHPESRAYSSEKQKQRREQKPAEIISSGFTKDTASKIGVSPRTIRHEVQIAEDLAE